MGHALWEDANPLSVSLFLTLCLPVCSAFSLCLCLGARIADKAFYQQPDADVIGYVYVCLTDHILPCTVWGSLPQHFGCPVKGRGDAGRYWALMRFQRENASAEHLSMLGSKQSSWNCTLEELVEETKLWSLGPLRDCPRGGEVLRAGRHPSAPG